VTLIDNASTDGLTDWLRDIAPNAVVLRNVRTQGFARAHNQAIALSLSRWAESDWPERLIALMHPDVIVSADGLEQLAAAFRRDSDLMIAGPKILCARAEISQDGESRDINYSSDVESAGVEMHKTRRVFPRLLDQPSDVFGFSSVCVVFRASVLAKLKLAGEWLDEDLEESAALTDLMWRAKWLGLKTQLIPTAVLWHHPHVGTETDGAGAWLPLCVKNETFGTALPHTPWILFEMLRRLLLALINPRKLWSGLRTWMRIPRFHKKRQELMSRTRVPAKQMRAWFV
jgi:GT2 family glycosyltransferase